MQGKVLKDEGLSSRELERRVFLLPHILEICLKDYSKAEEKAFKAIDWFIFYPECNAGRTKKFTIDLTIGDSLHELEFLKRLTNYIQEKSKRVGIETCTDDIHLNTKNIERIFNEGISFVIEPDASIRLGILEQKLKSLKQKLIQIWLCKNKIQNL